MPRRAAAAVAVATAAAGAVLAGVALAADAATQVTLGSGSGTVSPATASGAPGGTVQFRNAGASPFVVSRTASPFTFGVTVQPSSTSAPLTLPTAAGTYAYTVQEHGTVLLMDQSVGSPVAAAIDVPQTPDASPSIVVVSTATPDSPAPSGSSRPASRSTDADVSKKPSSTASPTPSDFSASLSPGEVLPPPVALPTGGAASSVPLPELPTSVETADPFQAAQPAAPATSAVPSPVPSDGRIAADAPAAGPRRSRGLPIALALVLLLGVGGAVVRAFRAGRR